MYVKLIGGKCTELRTMCVKYFIPVRLFYNKPGEDYNKQGP